MNKILILITLLFSGIIFSQTTIDENITVKFPSEPKTLENVAKTDTLNETLKTTLKAYYLNSKEESYVVMRLKVLADDELEPKLPQSQSDLIAKYKRFIAGQLNSFAKKGMYIKDTTQINLNNYLAYKLIFKGENSDQEIGQSLILHLNGIIYEFVYSKVDSYNHLNKEKFFKSIEINNSEEIKQIAQPYNYWNALLKLLLGGIFLYFIIKFLKMEKKRNLIK
ncbi:hypothetical protein ACRASX_15155 [Flavobacterium sp. TMP13]|uniref:hypothetical protein n=1 Tax=Flavobacterium sp. TMP13 TaxID=3425950 RepID=UPI003D785414